MFEKLSEVGCMGLCVPEAYGGVQGFHPMVG
ncbi:MAG: acyl-CoA dehydrogenase family protein [Actinomycetota bacterium]|nr:acyl-CoA dehydrogenase family protein [Actinomycetota bacterium]